jgi:hypothetical protein
MPGSDVDLRARLGQGVPVRHLAQIRDAPAFALVGGPVQRIGRAGVVRTATDGGWFRCVQTSVVYVQVGGTLLQETS